MVDASIDDVIRRCNKPLTDFRHEDFEDDNTWIEFLRERRGIKTFKDVFTDLKERKLISYAGELHLEDFCDYNSKELDQLMYKRDIEFPAKLKNFACHLHFASLEAYSYVKSTFMPTLPDDSTVRGYLMSEKGEPGIASEVINLISKLCREAEAQGKKLLFSLIFDEMTLQKDCVEMVNIGNGADENIEVHSAAVFMRVGLNVNVKVTAAYYLVHHANGEEKNPTLTDLLHVMHEHSIPICSVVFNALGGSEPMVEKLGTNFSDEENLITSFAHPVTGEPITAIPDHTQYVKLLRLPL